MLPRRHTISIFSYRQTVVNTRRPREGSAKYDQDNVSGTFLELLSASSEKAGACFGLEPLAGCFAAASLDDRMLVFGWAGLGKEDHLR